MNRRNVGGSVRAAVMLLCIVAYLALPASRVAAHAFLESSDPTANAVLPTAPQTVTLTFTEPLERSYSRAELFDATGASIPGTTSTIGPQPRSMVVQIPPGLGNGTYSLLWRTLSTADGHTAQGYLPFTIGTQADVRIAAPPAIAENSAALPEWSLAVARWLALLGMAAVAAVWPVWLFVVRPAISPGVATGTETDTARAGVCNRRFRLLPTGRRRGAGRAGGSHFRTGGPGERSDDDAQRNSLRHVVAGACGRPACFRRRAVGVGVVVAVAETTGHHARPCRQRSTAAAVFDDLPRRGGARGEATAIAFDYAHLLGASLWAGGLLFLTVALAPTVRDLTAAGRRVVLGRALPRFSLLALIAWGVMGFTGFYSAWLQVGNIPALIGTPYGQTLILKLILIVPLLALGAFNLIVVTRKLRAAETEERVEGWSNHFVSALVAEAVIVTLLLGVVGMLIGTPPARQVIEQQAGRCASLSRPAAKQAR